MRGTFESVEEDDGKRFFWRNMNGDASDNRGWNCQHCRKESGRTGATTGTDTTFSVKILGIALMAMLEMGNHISTTCVHTIVKSLHSNNFRRLHLLMIAAAASNHHGGGNALRGNRKHEQPQKHDVEKSNHKFKYSGNL